MQKNTGIVISVVVTLAAVVLLQGLELSNAKDALKVSNALYETGACGSKFVVPVDNNRIAIAGDLVSPVEVSDYSMRDDPQDNRKKQYIRKNSDGYQVLFTR